MIVPLEQISYVDYPEILINEHERTEMPFRYVKDDAGEPIMPQVSTISYFSNAKSLGPVLRLFRGWWI